MATSVASVTKHFPSAENGFTTTLASTISSGAVTVPLNSVAGYSNGEVVVFIVDPSDATKKQSFTGTIDTSGVQVTGVVWTSGTNQTHTAGSTVVDYVDAAHISMVSKGLLVEHDQDGTHGAVTASSVTATTGTFTNLTVSGTATSQGWTALGDVPDTVTANGNRNYDLVFNGVDHTSTLSPGMKMQLTRTVAAPDQCADLEASSSQYFSKTSPTGISFTTTFTCSAWVKLESYTAGGIIARRNADTEGWSFGVNSSGQVFLAALRIASNNKLINSYASLPLNKWVHVAATFDVAAGDTTAQKVWFDGVEVARAYSITGTCAALVQGTTALVVGANKSAGTEPFDGKIAQAAVFSSQLSDATVKAMMNQGLSGSESTLISAYSLDNSLLDLTANDNDLTAQGSAVATNADSPFANAVTAGLLEYAEVNSVTFSTNTTVNVRVPDTCQIPTSGGVSAVSYSTQSNPYGLPAFSNIIGSATIMSQYTSTTTPAFVDVPGLSVPVVIPVGRKVRVTIKSSRTGMTGGGYVTYAIREGSTALDQGIWTMNNSSFPTYLSTVLSPTTGSHTYLYSIAQNTAGTLSIAGGANTNAATDGLAYIQVELV